VEGRNFGPIGTPVQNATYGPGSTEFEAIGCYVLEAHTKIECQTAVGAGDSLTWSIEIEGQVSVSPTTDYHFPVITGFRGPGAVDASTDGGEQIVVIGDFFSVNQHLEKVTYGPSGEEFDA